MPPHASAIRAHNPRSAVESSRVAAATAKTSARSSALTPAASERRRSTLTTGTLAARPGGGAAGRAAARGQAFVENAPTLEYASAAVLVLGSRAWRATHWYW